MDDIVERLRNACEDGCSPDLIDAAVAHIERIEAELRALRDVARLAKFAAAKLHCAPIEGSLTLAEALDAALAKARAAGEGG